MEEELEETSSLRHRSTASRHHHHHQRRRAKKPAPSTTNYDDVFGGPPKHAVPFSGVPDDYSEVFGGVSVSCSIPFLDLPTAQMDGWDCASGDSVNGVDYREIFGRCDFADFAVPYEELFGRGNGDGGDIDMHFSPASANGRSSVNGRSGSQTIDPSVFIQESSNEDRLPYLDDLDFSVSSSEMPREYNTSYNKASRAPAKELIHAPASVPQPQSGFTFVVEPNKPLPEHLPVVTEDTTMLENSVKPIPRSSANSQSISNREPVPLEVSSPDVIDIDFQAKSTNLPPPGPKFVSNERQKTNTLPKMELLHAPASVPQPQSGFTFVVEPNKPLPEHLPVVTEDTTMLENSVKPIPRSSANSWSISNREPVPLEVSSPDVIDIDFQAKSTNLPPPGPKFVSNERQKTNTLQKMDSVPNFSTETEQPQQEKLKPFLKSDSLPPNFDFVPNLKLDKREKPKLKSRPNTISKSESLPPGLGGFELDVMKEAMEFAQAQLKTAKELHERRREGKITELPLKKKHVKEENLECSEREKPRVLRSISLASNFSKSREFMKLQGEVGAAQSTPEWEKSGKWRSDEEFHELSSIVSTKLREDTVELTGTEPLVGADRESMKINGVPPTEVGSNGYLNADVNNTENIEQAGEIKYGESLKREEKTTIGSFEILTGGQESMIEIEKETGEIDTEVLKEDANVIPNVEEKENTEEVEAETEDGKGSKLAVETETEEEDSNRLDEEMKRQREAEELEKERQREIEMKEEGEEEKERARKLEEENERALQLEEEKERARILEEEERKLQMEKEKEEKGRKERERIMAEEEERLEKEREDQLRKLAEEKERERKLEEERRVEKLREKEMVQKLEEEKERERKLEEEIQKERERVRMLEEEREQERERVRKLEEEKQREREMVRKLEKDKERERELEEEIEKDRERIRKLEEERELEREKVRKLEEERELERERVRKLEEEREQERERVRLLEEEREKERMEKERERKEREKLEQEREQKERERLVKEREQKELEKKLEEEKEKQRLEKEKEEREKRRRMEKEREEKELAMRLGAEMRKERERAEEMERVAKLQGEKTKDRRSDPRRSDEERERERRMKEKDRRTESRKSDEEREKVRERKSDEERERERRARKEREIEEREREEERKREREKDRLAMERATQERAERIAIERITAARQRAVENKEKEDMNNRGGGEILEKRRPKGEDEKKERDGERNAREARMRAERAAVERATAEARERAIEKAKAEAEKERDRLERYKSFNRVSSQDHAQEARFKRTQSDSALSQGHGESALRHKARLERQQRTAERAAKALAEKNRRDIMAQREQAERDRIAEHLDADVKRWSSGKEGNLRALLSTLQYILGQNSGWQPIHLTEVITAADVKKAYRKATLYVHPDKLQQRGASIQQKYICEKVFDLLKEAWNKFNSEER